MKPWEEYQSKSGPWEEYQERDISGIDWEAIERDAPVGKGIDQQIKEGLLSGVRGVNTLFPAIAGLPVDTATNLINLGIAGYGVVTGDPPDLLPQQIGGSEWIKEKIEGGLGERVFTPPDPTDPTQQNIHMASGILAAGALAPTTGIKQTFGNVARMTPAAAGAIIGKETSDDPLAPMAGMMVGALAPGAVGAIRSRVPKPQATQFVDDSGALTNDAISILKQFKMKPGDLSPRLRKQLAKAGDDLLTPEQAARYNEFLKLRMKPTKGQVTQDPTQQSFEQNVPGSAAISGRFADQNRRLLEEMQAMGKATGSIGDKTIAGGAIRKALETKSTALKKQVSKTYKAAREAKGVNSPLPKESADSFFSEAVRVLDDFDDVLPSAVRKRLIEYGALGGPTKTLTIGETDKFIKLVNSHYNTLNAPQAAGLDRLRNAMKESVDMMGSGKGTAAALFTKGRKAAVARHAEFSQKDIIQDIIKKKSFTTDMIPQEKIVDRIVLTGSIKDLDKIKGSLLKGSKAQTKKGKAAWNDLRGSTMQHLYDKATARYSVDQYGNKIFSSAALKKELDKIGRQKIEKLFTPDELFQIDKISRIGELRIPVAGAVNVSRTSPALLNMLGRITEKLPGGRTLLGGYNLGKAMAAEGKIAGQVEAALNPEAMTLNALMRGTSPTLLQKIPPAKLNQLMAVPPEARAGAFATLLDEMQQ